MEEESCTQGDFEKEPLTLIKVSDEEAGGEYQQDTEQSQEINKKAEAET